MHEAQQLQAAESLVAEGRDGMNLFGGIQVEARGSLERRFGGDLADSSSLRPSSRSSAATRNIMAAGELIVLAGDKDALRSIR